MERTIYRELAATRAVWAWAALLSAFMLGGLWAFVRMEHDGHAITGMTNQIVWGTPHVFAIFLIVAASGALNVASMASVFGRAPYKPQSRLSGVLAIALLAGGLAVLVLDLGRPDRLIVAMTYYNFSSIFAWNILLYTGFVVVVAVYLFVQMSRDVHPNWVKPAGTVAFLWRLALTTGTGSIFGWLVARPGYDAAIMAPLFIAMSFSLGLAVFMLALLTLGRLGAREIGARLTDRMSRLLGIFVAAVLYFTAVQHLTNLYAAEHGGIERFILVDGGIYTMLFWVVQMILGGVVPLLLVFSGGAIPTGRAVLAAFLVIAGGIAQLYVIVIGGQAYPMEIFPGYEVTSGFYDSARAAYAPSLPELALGLGGVALALFATGLGAKVLRILPTSLSDRHVEG